MKFLGYGRAVVSMLAKTSVKKNLYWEIKDKVFEESFNGLRMEKQKKKVRVYGIDSTAAIRARLIEILQERVMYHKDKFVAKILLDEMQAMEVKKSGKVEHSQNTHDDQVFSYLMALYVWYDGQNLAENFHILKSTLKTDEDVEIEENSIEDQLEQREEININEINYQDVDPELANTLEWVNKESKIITTDAFAQKAIEEMDTLKRIILTNDEKARKSYSEKTGLDEQMLIDPEHSAQHMTILPQSLFDSEIEDEEGQYNVLQGNLAEWWNKV